MNSGEVIKMLMLKNNVTVSVLADTLGVKEPQLSRWRNSNDIKLSTVKRICDGLGISTSEFYNALDS